VFLGTSRPQDIWIGNIEAQVFWGRLRRSRYTPSPTSPLISGLMVDFSPRWIPRLTVGLARVFVQTAANRRFIDYLAVLQPFPKADVPGGDNPDDNQLASVFARWVFPESGVEVYGELAREDHEGDWQGVIREPDHAMAYLLGLQKVWRLGSRWVRAYAELTHLQELRPIDNARGVPVFYTHGRDLSYTHEGQPLGAWIGPGADSQTLAVEVFDERWRIGGFIERVRRNEWYYWTLVEPVRYHAHDAELAFGLRHLTRFSKLELSWEVAYAHRFNRDFLGDERNFRAALELSVPLDAR
jgi:hypothetical protein